MLSTRGHRRNDKPRIRCPLCSRTGHSALKCREFQIIPREKKPNGYQRDGEHGGNGGGGSNGGGSKNGGGGRNGRGGESGGVGGNRGGSEENKSSTGSESSDKTASLERYVCLEPHRASECPKRSASATAPATPNSQHGGILGSVRTNLGAGLHAATSARPVLAARGASRERHENEYWVADSDATENRTQDSSHLEDYTPPPPRRRGIKRQRGFSPCRRIRAPTTPGGPK